MSNMREWCRRDFLRAAGVGVAAPAIFKFLPIPQAQAQAANIKRLVLFNHGNGMLFEHVRSNGSGTPFVSGAALPQLRGPILAPLEPHRQRLALLDGLSISSCFLNRTDGSPGQKGHNALAGLWSGARQSPYSGATSPTEVMGIEPSYSSAPTIDHILGANMPTLHKNLVLAPAREIYYAHGFNSYRGPSQPVVPQFDPAEVFDTLFAGLGVDTGAVRRRASRRSLFSHVRGELGRVRAELDGPDREQLDRHLDGLDALDGRIGAEAGTTCQSPPKPTSRSVTTNTVGEERLLAARAHFDLIQHAFACDLTRVVTFFWNREGAGKSWLPVPAGQQTDYHSASHETFSLRDENGLTAPGRAATDWVATLHRSIASEFSGLLTRLTNANLMDDTIAVWGSAMAWGGLHTTYGNPFVVAAGARTGLTTNRYHRWGDMTFANHFNGSGRTAHYYEPPRGTIPHSRLLMTLLRAMGRSDVQFLGDNVTRDNVDHSVLTELLAG